MSELVIAPDASPAAGPYSPGLVVGDWIFLSGQGGFDPDTGELVRAASTGVAADRGERSIVEDGLCVCGVASGSVAGGELGRAGC